MKDQHIFMSEANDCTILCSHRKLADIAMGLLAAKRVIQGSPSTPYLGLESNVLGL